MFSQTTSQQPWWEKPRYHPRHFWHQEHRVDLLQSAAHERLAKVAAAGRPSRASLVASVGDALISCGLWLKARSRSLHAQ